MRLTRLEIFGFKSFVERFVLNFDRNMIGIVGPNGCGKSNVVDALRWVLGETYAKQLRGNVFDDLIFNGSESRRPLGMAEVSITIRPHENWQELALAPVEVSAAVNADLAEVGDETSSSAQVEEVLSEVNALPAVLSEIPDLMKCSEIQFTRRLYRSGESEYFINRVPCRLRDMTDIYRLIGLGARGLSIVQQGEIGELISKKPIERRELLEEAAGISGFRTRMEAAQRKLERTRENMLRLRDIVLEVEKQVRVLQRQARRARDRNELKSELQIYDLELYTARSARISIVKKRQQAVHESLEAELERVKSELAVSEATQMELRAQLESFEVSLADKRRERDGLQQLLEANRAQIAEIRLSMALASERVESLKKSISLGAERRIKLGDEINTHRARVSNLDEQLRAKRSERQVADEALEEILRRSGEASGSEQLDFSEAFSDSEGAQVIRELARMQSELEHMPAVDSELRKLEKDVEERERALKSHERLAHQKRMSLVSIDTEIQSLKAQLDALAEHVAKAVSADQPVAGLNRVFLAGLKVSHELQRSVAALLGERGQYLLSSSIHEMGTAFSKRPERESKRIGVIDQNYSDAEADFIPLSPSEQSLAPSARRLIDQIEIEAEFRSAAQVFFGDVILVDSLEEAMAVNSAGANRRSFVTRQGEVVHPWGWYSTEGKGQAFSFNEKLSELEISKTKAEEEARVFEEERGAIELALTTLRKSLIAQRVERERLFELQRRLVLMRKEEQEIERKFREKHLLEERKRREAIAAEERAAQQTLRHISSELSGLERESMFASEKISTLEHAQAAIDIEHKDAQAEIEKLLSERSEMEKRLSVNEETGKADLLHAQESARALEDAIRALDEQRNPVRLRLSEESDTVAQLRRELSQFQEQHSKTSLEIEKAELEERLMFEELTRTYPDAQPASTAAIEAILSRAEGNLEQFVTDLQEEAGKIRRRIEREGEVDPQSIELFEQEDARLQGMKTQLGDLESAEEILNRTIRQLKEVSRTRFLETFKAVSEKFSVLVPRLFGGGAGHLQLVNPDDPLESGVEIFVRPPGKKIANMELLSGGEKALVAVSVLISMFLHRPSPICVLDEVDAPLDEANLERYLDLITEISKNTQFLLITHNKRTMAQAERLVGITMQERGVSTALSVSLFESESEIDRWIANA